MASISNHTMITGTNICLTDQVPAHPADFKMTNKVWSEIRGFSPIAVLENPRFTARPGERPTDLFVVKSNRCTIPRYRFIRKNNIRQMLMIIDGACINNGTPNARAGWAVCVGPGRVIKGRLEPPAAGTGDGQTSNRAELRSAIVALGLRVWKGEGFNSVVLATDSEYVVKGFCDWLPVWKKRNWVTARGADVANRDLWEVLEEKIHDLAGDGVHVLFWRIPREWNEADKYAKQAANEDLESRFDTTSSSSIIMMEV